MTFSTKAFLTAAGILALLGLPVGLTHGLATAIAYEFLVVLQWLIILSLERGKQLVPLRFRFWQDLVLMLVWMASVVFTCVIAASSLARLSSGLIPVWLPLAMVDAVLAIGTVSLYIESRR